MVHVLFIIYKIALRQHFSSLHFSAYTIFAQYYLYICFLLRFSRIFGLSQQQHCSRARRLIFKYIFF